MGRREPEEIPDQEHDQLYQRVCAIDVAKDSGKVCVRTPSGTGTGRRVSKVWEVEATFNAVSQLGQELVGMRIEKVTVESTSDYWRIWFYLLEAAGLEVQLVNAREVKNAPGRPKTDRLDSIWLAKHPPDVRADTLVAGAPPEAWKRMSCGEGAKGPRLYDWALATVHFETEPGYQRWLLARRSLTPNSKGEREIADYLCHAPAGTTMEELIRIAGARWAIEECFQSAKNEVGLDQYQVRRYDAWHRHITLAMLAHAYLAVTAAHAPKAQAAWSASHPRRSVVSWHT